MNPLVKLVRYQDLEVPQRSLADYLLTNTKYTIHPQKKIKEARTNAKLMPILIQLSSGEIVGFLCLSDYPASRDYTVNPQAILFGSLSVDERFRGKQYAKQTLALLPDFVKANYLSCDEVVLGVNHNNVAARDLYLVSGFTDTGRQLMGPLGVQHILSYKL